MGRRKLSYFQRKVRFADITNSASSVDKNFGKGFPPVPITPRSGCSLAPSCLKESFEILKQKVPFFILLCWSWAPPVFSQRESLFLFLRLKLRDDWAEQKMQGKLSLEKFPRAPLGIWEGISSLRCSARIPLPIAGSPFPSQ